MSQRHLGFIRLLNNLENSFLSLTVYGASLARARWRNTGILSYCIAPFSVVLNISKTHTGVMRSHSSDSAPSSHKDSNEPRISLTVHVWPRFLGDGPHKSCTASQARIKQINVTDCSISQHSSWYSMFLLSKELIKLGKA